MDVKKDIVELLVRLTGLDEEVLTAAVEVPPAGMGDYALPCFKLAKSLRKAPQAIAADLAERASGPDGLPPSLDRVSALRSLRETGWAPRKKARERPSCSSTPRPTSQSRSMSGMRLRPSSATVWQGSMDIWDIRSSG